MAQREGLPPPGANLELIREVVLGGVSLLRAPPPVRMADWLRNNFRLEDGKPFDEFTVPWVTAPNGPCEAVDDKRYTTLWLQWSARMFKTTFGQAVLQKYADCDPCNMMLATVDQELCKRVFKRMWRMLSECPTLRDQCPSERLQNQFHIKLAKSQVFGAWSRGKSRLADQSIRIGHANETDKWVQESTSTEGDPLQRFFTRGQEFREDKLFIVEGTPAEKSASRIEPGRLRSSNCQFWVPCPRCSRYQPLEFGDRDDAFGIKWEHLPNGSSDPDLAARSATYICRHCEGEIKDTERPEMSFRGVWVPEGCQVDDTRALSARELPQFDRSWLRGDPLREGSDWGSRLPVWYGLFGDWGDFAREFLVARRKKDTLHWWINERAARTWERVEKKLPWEDVVDRFCRPETSPGIVPSGFSLLTVAVDKQSSDVHDAPYPWVVVAWDADRRGHVVEYGYATSLEEIEEVLLREYEHADGGAALTVSEALVDSGFRPRDVVGFTRSMRDKGVRIHMCKGSSVPMQTLFRKRRLGRESATPGEYLVNIDTSITQDWIEAALHSSSYAVEETVSLYAVAHADEHHDIASQLTNDALDPAKGTWNRANSSEPNDYRDCIRYAKAALEIHTRHGRIRGRNEPEIKRARRQRQGFVRRRGRSSGGFVRKNRSL